MSKLRRLGKYRFIAEIGRGGMAEVYLAVMEGPARFSKLIAVKVLREQFADQAEGREMFLNEARLAARLSHPNVVSVLEVGEEDGNLFMAMEYLRGQPMSRLLNRIRATNDDTLVPLPVLLRILSEALAGLHHAHECADFDGTPLMLVHRDVTPHNIFVTYDGMVKMLDFGIAKAMSLSSSTRAGTVKGKVAFMPREQLLGDAIDRRVDIYAVGCCLWEVIAKRRPFAGMTDVAVMTHAASTGIPSIREAVPDVPAELERICMKACAYDAADRYQDAAEFQNDLDSYIASLGGQVGRKEIGTCVSTVFAEEQARTKELIEANLAAVSLTNTDEFPLSSLPGLATTSGSWSQAGGGTGSGSGSLSSMNRLTISVPDEGAQAASAGATRRKLMVVGAVVAALGVGGIFLLWHRSSGNEGSVGPAASADTVRVKIDVTPSDARIFVDGKEQHTNPAELTVPRDPGTHTVRAEAPGHVQQEKSISFNADQDVSLVLEHLPADATSGSSMQPDAAPRDTAIAASPPRPRGHGAPPAPAEAETKPPPTATTPPPGTGTAGNGKKKRPLDVDNPFADK
jgi:serine/threonine protein kinase